MAKIKKITYCLPRTELILMLGLLFIVYCLLFIAPVQSQTSEINITLTWSTDTYVPFDYPGKALPTRGSVIEVAVNIDSQEINPQELIYQWFLDDNMNRK